MQTLSQKYAVEAYQRVENASRENDKYQKKYGTMAHKLPILIRTAGLVQALAFVAAKGAKNRAWQQYLTDVAETVQCRDSQELIQKSQTATLNEYIRLTQEVSAALLWYKRFAESILKVEASEQMEEASSDQEDGT